jgi:ABC-type transport system involved in multi-copper enzyme maturation permease subunit
VDSPAPPKALIRVRPLLPYWAVLQADIHQTMRSWVYRTWVLVSVSAAVGYLLYRVGVYREAGIVQHASTLISDLLRWCVFGSVTLIIVLTAGSISSERGTLADSVLSRGISRYQYFLGKWHARLVTLLGTFLVMALLALAGSFGLLHEDLSLKGSAVALIVVAALLGVVISCGVTVSAFFNSSLLSIAVLWIVLYGVGFALLLLPAHYPSPYRVLNGLPAILRGEYNLHYLSRLVGWSALASCAVAIVGIGYFSRRDV